MDSIEAIEWLSEMISKKVLNIPEELYSEKVQKMRKEKELEALMKGILALKETADFSQCNEEYLKTLILDLEDYKRCRGFAADFE